LGGGYRGVMVMHTQQCVVRALVAECHASVSWGVVTARYA